MISRDRNALTLCAALAICAGCSGIQPAQENRPAPIAALQPAATAARPEHGRSWMSPAARRIPKLVYVSDWSTNDVFVYDYASGKQVGLLTGFTSPYGQCVDAKGDVWIADSGATSVVEYAHGAKRAVQTLTTDGSPWGCSIDPVSGDLAVANFSNGDKAGNLEVFTNPSQKPAEYQNGACLYPMFPAYDDKGNLYLQAEGGSSLQTICVLARGSSSMKKVAFDRSVDQPDGMMWDGKYMAVSAYASGPGLIAVIYQAQEVNAGDLVVIGSTTLSDTSCSKSYISVPEPFVVGKKNTPANKLQGTAVVGGNDQCPGRFDFWQYPAGGNPKSSRISGPQQPEGQSVSIKA
jgi:hypothetical protein